MLSTAEYEVLWQSKTTAQEGLQKSGAGIPGQTRSFEEKTGQNQRSEGKVFEARRWVQSLGDSDEAAEKRSQTGRHGGS